MIRTQPREFYLSTLETVAVILATLEDNSQVSLMGDGKTPSYRHRIEFFPFLRSTRTWSSLWRLCASFSLTMGPSRITVRNTCFSMVSTRNPSRNKTSNTSPKIASSSNRRLKANESEFAGFLFLIHFNKELQQEKLLSVANRLFSFDQWTIVWPQPVEFQLVLTHSLPIPSPVLRPRVTRPVQNLSRGLKLVKHAKH